MEEVVMIGIVEILVDHQIEVVMMEEIIETGIEMIQEIDIKGMMIDMIEEIDIVEKDQGHLEIIILEDIEGEVIQVQDIKVVDHHLRNGLLCGKTGHNIEVCWDFQKYLEKIGRQLPKVKDSPSNKKRNDDDSSDKAFMMQSINSLLEDLGLSTESTNY